LPFFNLIEQFRVVSSEEFVESISYVAGSDDSILRCHLFYDVSLVFVLLSSKSLGQLISAGLVLKV
jgi:hypothetical protein